MNVLITSATLFEILATGYLNDQFETKIIKPTGKKDNSASGDRY